MRRGFLGVLGVVGVRGQEPCVLTCPRLRERARPPSGANVGLYRHVAHPIVNEPVSRIGDGEVSYTLKAA